MGAFTLPAVKSEGAFLKQNWDDAIIQMAHWVEKVKCATVFQKQIWNLTEDHWTDIIDAALALRECSVGKEQSAAAVVEVVDDKSEDDDELMDLKYDSFTDHELLGSADGSLLDQ